EGTNNEVLRGTFSVIWNALGSRAQGCGRNIRWSVAGAVVFFGRTGATKRSASDTSAGGGWGATGTATTTGFQSAATNSAVFGVQSTPDARFHGYAIGADRYYIGGTRRNAYDRRWGSSGTVRA